MVAFQVLQLTRYECELMCDSIQDAFDEIDKESNFFKTGAYCILFDFVKYCKNIPNDGKIETLL